MWDGLRQDIAFGARMLRRQPGFTAVAVFALALGIGANTAIFSVVDAVLWRPLPFPRADRRDVARRAAAAREPLVRTDRAGRLLRLAPRQPLVLGDGGATISRRRAPYNLTGDGEPERVRAARSDAGFLDVIGVTPALGRDFRAEEETVGRHRVVAAERCGSWRRALRRRSVGRRPHGRVERTDVRDRRRAAGAVLVADAARRRRAARAGRPRPHACERRTSSRTIGRLARRRAVRQARARGSADHRRAAAASSFRRRTRITRPNLRPLRRRLVGDVQTTLLVVLGAVGFVLLIACANVATLLLARAAARQKEVCDSHSRSARRDGGSCSRC